MNIPMDKAIQERCFALYCVSGVQAMTYHRKHARMASYRILMLLLSLAKIENRKMYREDSLLLLDHSNH